MCLLMTRTALWDIVIVHVSNPLECYRVLNYFNSVLVTKINEHNSSRGCCFLLSSQRDSQATPFYCMELLWRQPELLAINAHSECGHVPHSMGSFIV